MPNFPLIFVIGIAQSGTTLLGRMLDMHSNIICVGEMLRIGDAIEDQYPCSCGKQVELCDFWSNYIPFLKINGKLEYKRFSHKTFAHISSHNENKVVVDLSKTRVLRSMRGIFSRWNRNIFKDAAFVLMLRDPRGVSSSAMRRTGVPLDSFLSKYSKWMKRFQFLADRENERLITIHYEALCESPESEVKRLCRFFGVDFEPQMLSPAGKIHHFIHSSTSDYLKDVNKVKIDERWRSELRPDDLKKIESVISKIPILKNAYFKDGDLESMISG